MARNLLFDALKEIKEKSPKRIYLDEKTGEVKEEPLKDSAGSIILYKNPAKEIHQSIFGY
jgi:hypothetical protein